MMVITVLFQRPPRPPSAWSARTFANLMFRESFASFVLVALALPCSAQPPADFNRTDAAGLKQGVWTKSWPNGKVRYEGLFKDDRPVGEFRHYDEEGALTTIQRYEKGTSISRADHFYPSGDLMAKGRYIGQKKDSTWNYYDRNGSLRRFEQYSNGELHGEVVAYFANGSVAERENYVRGVLHGEHKSWFQDGVLKSSANYLNGEPEGTMTFWFPNGKKEIEGKVVNGNRDGTWFYYNQDGSIQLQVLYRNGDMIKEKKENGTFTEYYDDGQVRSEVIFKKGLREGRFAEYYDNGKWVLTEVPADPVLGAPSDVENVLQGQTLKMEGNYRNDALDGDVKEYDERGRVIKVTTYANGEVVDRK